MKVAVNGKKVAVKQKPGSYIAITRLWKDGDRITADYPMRLRVETTPDNPQKGALVYGPVVLAGERGTEGMQAPAPDSNPALYNDYYTYDYHIPVGFRTTLKLDVKHPERSVRRVGDGVKVYDFSRRCDRTVVQYSSAALCGILGFGERINFIIR